MALHHVNNEMRNSKNIIKIYLTNPFPNDELH